MSEWYEPKDDDISINHDKKDVGIYVKQDDFGAVYITLTFDQIESIYLKMSAPIIIAYPRIRNLPEKEREPFKKWLGDHLCQIPVPDTTVPISGQDWYYPFDYEAWKRSTNTGE